MCTESNELGCWSLIINMVTWSLIMNMVIIIMICISRNTINDRRYFTEYLTSQNVVRMKSDGRSVETICLPNQSLQTSVSMPSELSSYSSVDSPTKTLELPTISSAVPHLSSPPSSSVSSSLWGRLKSSMGSRHNSNSSPTTSSWSGTKSNCFQHLQWPVEISNGQCNDKQHYSSQY